MKPDAKQLDEVVVTGYVKISKNSFTGTSVTVSADQLMSVSKTNVLGSLQVFDPSFRIAENNMMGSNPNSVPELYIRGRSGIGTTELDAESLSKSALKNNPNLPTFIMDGFEISVEKLYDMDPSRIESITILKDAADIMITQFLFFITSSPSCFPFVFAFYFIFSFICFISDDFMVSYPWI